MSNSFFDMNYQTPTWFIDKSLKEKLTRRSVLKSALKSAAGASAVVSTPIFSLTTAQQTSLAKLSKTDPWLTLDATLNHLLPESFSSATNGPSAEQINALAYLHQVMTVQPTSKEEKEFIIKGVGWLNSYAQSEKKKIFVLLSFKEKEQLLRGISLSLAGENWINTLLNYIFEAMLTPPSYGGNPNGIGWQWLEHQAGFPLPEKGQRYFELPARSTASNTIATVKIDVDNFTNKNGKVRETRKS